MQAKEEELSTVQKQKQAMEQRLKKEIAGLNDEQQRAAASAAAQIQACVPVEF